MASNRRPKQQRRNRGNPARPAGSDPSQGGRRLRRADPLDGGEGGARAAGFEPDEAGRGTEGFDGDKVGARAAGFDEDPAGDLGLADPPADPTFAGATPAPNPLKHASAEVDEALLAEAGAVHPDAPGEELVDRDANGNGRAAAPDEVEGDLVPRRLRTPAQRELDPDDDAPGRAERERERAGVAAFLRHCIDELRRVQWPNRRQVAQATAVVLGFVVLAGGYLGLLDALWRPLIDAIL